MDVRHAGVTQIDSTAYWNLADLYQNFLKDYPKAEMDYKKVIAIDPSNTGAYTALAQMYTTVYKQGNGSAEAILKQGIRPIRKR